MAHPDDGSTANNSRGMREAAVPGEFLDAEVNLRVNHKKEHAEAFIEGKEMFIPDDKWNVWVRD